MSGITKQQGQSTHNYRYDAYGQLLPAHGNWTAPHNHYTFSGKEWDAHLDSYEFGYRQYDPAAGVWLTQEVDDRSRQGMAWMMLGHALLRLGQLEDAAEAHHNSVALRRELDQPNLAMESLASLARVVLAQADSSTRSGQALAQAQAHIEEILSHLETGTLHGAIAPFEVYLTCYRVLKAGQDPRAQEVLATAYHLLQERAAKINDEELRCSYLENVASHRALMKLHNEFK